MRKTKETHTFDFRPLGLAIREARERAGLSRNDLGDKVFYGERHIADIENTGSHPSFQLFHDLVTMFNISVNRPVCRNSTNPCNSTVLHLHIRIQSLRDCFRNQRFSVFSQLFYDGLMT